MIPNEVVLSEVMKDTADAIREKTGKSELIKPVDFATEIKGITSGGSGESGGESGNTSNWRYFDTTKATLSEAQKPLIDAIFSIFKESYFGFTSITCNPPKLETWEKKYVVAMATDFNLKIYHPEITITGTKTIEETINRLGGVEALEQAIGFTEITEEEFYDLNA